MGTRFGTGRFIEGVSRGACRPGVGVVGFPLPRGCGCGLAASGSPPEQISRSSATKHSGPEAWSPVLVLGSIRISSTKSETSVGVGVVSMGLSSTEQAAGEIAKAGAESSSAGWGSSLVVRLSEEEEIGSQCQQNEEEHAAASRLAGRWDLATIGVMWSSGMLPAACRSPNQIVFKPTASFQNISVVWTVVSFAIDVHSSQLYAIRQFGLAFPLDIAIASGPGVPTLYDTRCNLRVALGTYTAQLRNCLRSPGIGLLVSIEGKGTDILQKDRPCGIHNEDTQQKAEKKTLHVANG